MNTPANTWPLEVPTVPMVMEAITYCFPARAEAASKLLEQARAIQTSPRDADYEPRQAARDNLLRQAWAITL